MIWRQVSNNWGCCWTRSLRPYLQEHLGSLSAILSKPAMPYKNLTLVNNCMSIIQHALFFSCFYRSVIRSNIPCCLSILMSLRNSTPLFYTGPGFSGGKLFECWVHLNGSRKLQKQLTKIKRLVQKQGTTEQSLELAETISCKFKAQFVGWLLCTLAQMGNFGKQQLFYFFLLAKYYGMSRTGLAFFAKMGMLSTLSTSDNYLETTRMDQLQTIK